MEKLHPKAVWLFFWHFFFAGLFLVAVILIFGFNIIAIVAIKIGVSWSWALFFSFLVLLVYVTFCYILAKLSYRFWGYELTEEALKIEKGIIFKKYISIPYDRIQNVDIYRGILARILGLSDLQIQTAGYSGGSASFFGRVISSEGRLPGLDQQTAERLREELIRRARSAKQGI